MQKKSSTSASGYVHPLPESWAEVIKEKEVDRGRVGKGRSEAVEERKENSILRTKMKKKQDSEMEQRGAQNGSAKGWKSVVNWTKATAPVMLVSDSKSDSPFRKKSWYFDTKS